MAKPSTSSTTFLMLNDIMRKDYREAVVGRALEYRKQAEARARRRLENAIRKDVRVHGFRNPLRASTGSLLKEIVASSYRSNSLMGALLQVWIESHADLRAAVQGFLVARGISIMEPSELEDGFASKWALTEMLGTSKAFRAEHPDFDEDDVALMLCYVTGRAPLPDETAENLAPEKTGTELECRDEESRVEGGVSDLKWGRWLEEIRALPADAPEWEAIQGFVETVQQVAKDKRQEIEATRSRLQQAITDLVEQAADQLDYFGLTDVATWTAEMCPLGEAEALAEQVDQLREMLVNHLELRQRPAGSLGEDRQRRKELDELEEGINQAHTHLASVPMTSILSEEPPPEPKGEPPEEKAPCKVVTPAELTASPVPPTEEVAAPEVAEVEVAAEVTEPTVEIPSQEPEEEVAESAGELAKPEPTTSLAEDIAAPESAEDEVPVEIAEPTVETPSEAPAEPSEREKIVPTDELVESEPIPVLPPELHSPREAAILLQTDDRDENWHSLLWAFIGEDDLPAAYWLARSLAASERVSPVPDWLLAAAQGARWLSPDSDTFVSDLLEMVQNHHPTSDDMQELIGLAAALRPVLIAPFSGLVGWLKAPVCYPILYDLVTAVSAFASLGIALRPEDLLGLAGAEQREAALTETVHAAKQWLDKASGRRTKPKRASDVWHYLVKNDLQVLLLPVSEDQRAEVERVRQYLHPWQQRDDISDRIDQIDREVVKTRFRPIVGPARQQLIRRVEEACRLASRWCNLAEHEREIETRGEWLTEQVSTLRTRVSGTLPEVEKALDRLGDSAQPASLAAASHCLRRALMQLRQTLHLPYEPSDTKSPAVKAREWLPLNAENLYIALNRRLLWLPEVPLSENGQPLEDGLPLIAQALRDACVEERSLRAAFEGWLQRQDYRFVEWLLNALRDEVDVTELSRRRREAIQGSKAALRDNINETSNAIEQALVDGIIADERSEYSAIVEAVNPAETLNFPLKYDELRSVRDSLLAARQKRLTELRVNWQGVQKQFETSHIEAAKQEVARGFVQAALDRGDTRVVEASLALLLETIDTGGELDDRLFAPVETRDVLAEFLESAPRIEGWLEEAQGLQRVATDVERGRTRAEIRFARVPGKRREEAAKAVSSWRRLKQQPPGQRENPDHIATLLRYLGFSFELGMGAPVQVEGRGKGWLHVRASMSASDLARPIPQFGSQAHGHYDVVCLWERPGAGTIAARLRELRLNVHNVLVFYLGRLTARQKRDVTRISREQRLALAVLDETLMVFLAQERDARLPIFLRCALPFAALNPYTPFQAGDVPPEMFFGREAMAHELQRPAGSCLVYGGRQLGKSALLRHVERQFSYPEREQYAWVKNLKLIFDPLAGKETDNIWRELREDFKRERLISPQVRTDRPEEIARYIREAMLQSTDRRVLVMFDEADDFLDADSVDGFRVVTALRELMLETQRRFKVVFTGLHNVQRFQGIPNQPLAHFGAPLCVGPLEPDAAQQLVRQPLEALGYYFADDATVLRILSYTNYHPGLIQLFCQELLKRLHEPGVSTMPPYRIEQSDVEAVYRNREKVREPIRERFDWTLALDMHYQAIAWTLIYDQMEMRDSYAQAYPPGDILKLVRDYWPQGFSEVGTEELRSLLDEMRGLGVLVRNANGHYRLRSPNLVRLMGTETDIENRLSELSEKHPPVSFDADNHHAPLDDAARRYSPLTHSQERSLNLPQFGVSLVFASEALGLSALPEAFSRFVPRDENVGGFTEISSSVASGEGLRNWLDRHMQIHSSHERLVAYYRPRSKAPKDLESLVREALSFCDRHQSHRRWMRVLFLFDPQATWAWLSLSPNIRENLEDCADAVVTSRRWNLIGVRRRLAQHDKMGSDVIREQILRATGGWPCLLDILFDRCGKQDDPRPFAEAIERELTDSSLHLGQQFRQSLGLEGNDVARRVLDFVIREGQWPADLVVPDLVGGEPVLTPEECARAVEYLRLMGCVELHGDAVQAERIVEKVMPQL